jgi:hypothetical protein
MLVIYALVKFRDTIREKLHLWAQGGTVWQNKQTMAKENSKDAKRKSKPNIGINNIWRQI